MNILKNVTQPVIPLLQLNNNNYKTMNAFPLIGLINETNSINKNNLFYSHQPVCEFNNYKTTHNNSQIYPNNNLLYNYFN